MSIALRGLKAFLRRTELLPHFYHLLNRARPTFDSLHPANLKAITQSYQQAPSGYYYEFGVYKGFSLWFATQIADALGRQEMRFFGFDSFDGLPTPTGIDREPDAAGNTFARGCFCAGQKLVADFLEQYGADMRRIALIPGFFEDVLKPDLVSQHDMRPAALILIDCDMYQSTRTVLDFIPNILQPGTVILFDDWLLTDENKGQRLAYREWRQQRPAIQLEEFCDFSGGKGFRVIGLPQDTRRILSGTKGP